MRKSVSFLQILLLATIVFIANGHNKVLCVYKEVMMIKNIHFRLIIVAISILLLSSVFISGYLLFNGQSSIFWHMTWACLFTISLIFHVMLRKKRLLKMIKEAFQKESSNDKYDYHTLLESLSQRSLEELSQYFQLEEHVIQDLLIALNIKVKNFQETLGCIAKNNDYNEQKLFVMMMEVHMQTIKKGKK